jgi:(2Fe-2S) ferredoxin
MIEGLSAARRPERCITPGELGGNQLKRCKVLFVGVSGEIYYATMDGDYETIRNYVQKHLLGDDIIEVIKESDAEEDDRVWFLDPRHIESFAIEEEFEE